jgi:hypothetical protein
VLLWLQGVTGTMMKYLRQFSGEYERILVKTDIVKDQDGALKQYPA